MLHVKFFADNGRRVWITGTLILILPYNTVEQHQISRFNRFATSLSKWSIMKYDRRQFAKQMTPSTFHWRPVKIAFRSCWKKIVPNRSYPTDDELKVFLLAITGRIVRIWRPKAAPFPHPRESASNVLQPTALKASRSTSNWNRTSKTLVAQMSLDIRIIFDLETN